MDENQTNMQQDMVVDATSQQPVDTQEHTSSPDENKQSAPEESIQARNFRELKEQAKQHERRARELEQRLQEVMQQQSQQPQESYDPDDLVARKDMQKELNNLRAELVETRLRTNYPDFKDVLTQDNIEKLRSEEPELAASIRLNPDLYGQGVAAYKAIKRILQQDVYKEDRQKAQENASKPRPLTSVNPQTANSPLSQANAFANGLTPELAAQLRKEMEEARKMR